MRVNVIATLEELSIHIERYDDPASLLCAAEGENPGNVVPQAQRYLNNHPERPVRALNLQVPRPLPSRRREQVERLFIGLLRQNHNHS